MVSESEVRAYLATVDYPADREAIVREAGAQGAPPDVLRALRAMPPDTYRTTAEVLSSAGTEVAPELSAADRAARARDKTHQQVAQPLRTATPSTRYRTSGPSK
jgi:Protein of unknown function (DUF2795)